jgi:hypothetical protein
VVNGGEWLVSCSDRFTPEERTRGPLDRSLCGFQCRSGRCDEEKTPALPGIELQSSGP